jgi:DNA-binding response OmpR family regulator
VRILVVEDEPEIAEAVVEVLTDDCHAVDHAADGERAAVLMTVNEYDLVILDRQIPPPTGVELLRRWRSEGRQTPVLMLTGSRTSIHDKVEGLDIGADDYLTKPFAFAELRARVRSLLRRRDKQLQAELTAADLVLDRAAHAVSVGGSAVELSPKEFALLEYLLVRKDEAVSRRELVEHVWDENHDSSSNVIDVLIHRLRKKIDGGHSARLLHTVTGVGYVIKGERS